MKFSNDKSQVLPALDAVCSRLRQFELEGTRKLESLAKELKSWACQNGASNLSLSQKLQDVKYRMDSFLLVSDTMKKNTSVLHSLEFKEIRSRETATMPAHARTFEWAIHGAAVEKGIRKPFKFLEWLQNSSGLFWISSSIPLCNVSEVHRFAKYACRRQSRFGKINAYEVPSFGATNQEVLKTMDWQRTAGHYTTLLLACWYAYAKVTARFAPEYFTSATQQMS